MSIVPLRKYIFLNSVKVNIIMVQKLQEMTCGSNLFLCVKKLPCEFTCVKMNNGFFIYGILLNLSNN